MYAVRTTRRARTFRRCISRIDRPGLARLMRTLLALCGKEMRVLVRDWHGLAVLFAVPILFILLLSLALKDAFDPSAPGRLHLPIVHQDHGDGKSTRLNSSN